MKILIGRTDVASFPDLEIDEIDVKVDSGAYTSAIHATEIKERNIDGNPVIQFKILDPSHPKHDGRVYRYSDYAKKVVKNSFGQSEERFVIETTIVLFGITYPISLSLSERTDLKYPVLLGRTFLNKRFIIDTTLKDLSKKSSK
jgi:hypothetical protein